MKKMIISFMLVMAVSAAAQITNTYFRESQKIFDDHSVGVVEIQIEPEYLDYIMNHVNSDSLFPADFVFTNHNISGDTVKNVGLRLRGTTSREAHKKSFKIDFNEFIKGQKFYRLEKMNLKAVFTDPSVIRPKLYCDIAWLFDIPCFRANYVTLYINGEYRGLYINVEHIDENYIKARFGNNDGNLYKCVAGADLTDLGADQEVYKNLINQYNSKVYELKTNKDVPDYSDLVRLIDVINNTPDDSFSVEIEKVFNIPGFLKCMALDAITGNWDNYWYLKNNFYLYHNTETNKFEWIPCDADETFGLWWDSNGGDKDFGTRNIYRWGRSWHRPLTENTIKKVELYRDIYSRFIKDLVYRLQNENNLTPQIDSLHVLITPALETDPYYGQDYRYSIDDFHRSYDSALSGFDHVTYGIKSFMSTRNPKALNQLYFYNRGPVILESSHSPEMPLTRDFVTITSFIIDDDSITSAKVRYDNGSGYQEAIMYDDGNYSDGLAGDHLFAAIIPPQPAATAVVYYILTEDTDLNETTDPVNAPAELFSYQLVPVATPSLFINEFLASNDSINGDEYGEYDDWIELYNAADTLINLKGKYLTDNFDNPDKWQLPDTTIPPKGFLLIWADKEPEQGVLHTNFKLKKSGEQIGLYDTDANGKAAIDTLTFGLQATDISSGRRTNGSSSWKFFKKPTPGLSNSDSAVPVKFLFFESYVTDTAIFLNWKTSQAASNYSFVIERSRNGVDFGAIGKVNGETCEFIDQTTAHGFYFYRLKQIESNEDFNYSKIITVELMAPKQYKLSQNYPNPFNSSTMLKYELPEAAHVNIGIFNILGHEIRTLVNEKKKAGSYLISWDGLDNNGKAVVSAIYFYRMSANSFYDIHKMTVLK